ncbi:hypothetical protein J2766_001087 [Agrobacterium tumefaciens]|uniref:Peptidoglycan-binding protein n=1 Tax=Agrobacterium tumefaciens TaxID=358 RepID=A0AAW8LSJ0_AGRTU|nr:hypothetical protein [Agrobacterium tumefaciens]MBP2564528.1 hypothetical protein [Agrobacterium tumefaciens]MDR6701607.1 hypothetical protein [Agrobacterium tumefaciens]
MAETVSQLGFEAERRRRLAQTLSSQSQGPAKSHWEGLSQLINSGMAGYQMGKADDAEKQMKKQQQEALSAALDPSRKRSELPQILANGGYSDAALKIATEKPDTIDVEDQAKQALLKANMGQPLSAQEQAAVDSYNQIKGMERIADPDGNLQPKYLPLSLGGNQQAGAPPRPVQTVPRAPQTGDMQAAQAAWGGQPGILPPPAENGVAGQPMPQMQPQADPGFRPTPKANAAYNNAMATAAAERDLNGGVPKMTETQSTAASRSTLMNTGLRGMNDALVSGNVSPLNMALADTAANAGPIGEWAANQMRTPEEQRFSASKSAALEGIASAVTGAGVTQDQFARFSNMLPSGGETPENQRFKMANAYEFLLTQTKIAGPVADEIRGEVMRLRSEGAPAPSNGLTPEEQAELLELEKLFGGR